MRFICNAILMSIKKSHCSMLNKVLLFSNCLRFSKIWNKKNILVTQKKLLGTIFFPLNTKYSTSLIIGSVIGSMQLLTAAACLSSAC